MACTFIIESMARGYHVYKELMVGLRIYMKNNEEQR